MVSSSSETLAAVSAQPPWRPQLDALPRDVAATLLQFLLGLDLLRVSHVNRRLRDLINSDDALWVARLVAQYGDGFRRDTFDWSFKRRVLSSQSLRFRGREKTPGAVQNEKGSCANIRGLVLEWGEIVAFDLWFSLLPADDMTHQGGVLLGVQSAAFTDTHRPFYHQQFIVVDGEQRDLYCSVISDKQRVATALQTKRWYHLACMFDGRTQRVLLDGQLVSQVDGAIHHEAYSLKCMQLGTGCVSAGSPGRPTPSFTGWYGFNGVVDEFRTWGMTLSNAAVQRLARGKVIEERPRYSLRYSGMRSAMGGAKQLHCSRPLERVCELYS
jgi:hypothetical protein